MADANIPVQSATPQANITFAVKTFTAVDPSGATVNVQALTIVDENGRVWTPMSEATGQAILACLQQLLQQSTITGGGLL